MAIDYMIKYPCNVRKVVTDEQLLGLLKQKYRGEIAIEQVRTGRPHLSLQQILEYKMTVLVMTAQGKQEQRQIPLSQIVAQAAPLEKLSVHCTGCPANLNKSAASFGCTGAIHYPISKKTEEWLVARLPDNVDAPSLSLLFKYLADFDINGAPVDSQRGRREVYELKAPIIRKWGGWLSKKTVSSSQIIHMLVMMGALEPAQTIIESQLLNFSDIQPAAAGAQEEPGVAQFKSFMASAAFAGKAGSGLFIDA